jgi:hypothetical protein
MIINVWEEILWYIRRQCQKTVYFFRKFLFKQKDDIIVEDIEISEDELD